jgi:hypothetical protein
MITALAATQGLVVCDSHSQKTLRQRLGWMSASVVAPCASCLWQPNFARSLQNHHCLLLTHHQLFQAPPVSLVYLEHPAGTLG